MNANEDIDIERAILQVRSELQRKTIDQLIADQWVLYEIIDKYGEIAPETLYWDYKQ